MQTNLDLASSPTLHPREYHEEQIDAKLSHDFDFKLNIISSPDDSQFKTEEEYEDCEEEGDDDNDDDEEFSFVTMGSDSSPISADDVFQDGQIRPVYPLFNQKLLLSHEDFKISENRLPCRPPVEKVFIEAPPSPSSSSGKTDEFDGIAAGPYCAWTKTPELSKKSNSTGFSKLWRFKDYMHRSHSDGRDAFVFLNNSETAKGEVKVIQSKSSAEGSSERKTAGDAKVNAAGEKKNVKKVKKKTLSAHEVYLRNKGYNTEEDKRRSYLPYRPELVGFFTNVSGGGLTKNVHPY